MPISEAAHHYFDALDFHQLDLVDGMLSDSFQLTGNVTQELDKQGMLTLMRAYFGAFYDFSFNFTNAQQTGQTLRVNYQLSGTHNDTLDLTPLGVAITVEPTEEVILLPKSSAEIHFDESDKVVSQVMHQAEGSSMSDLLLKLGIEMPPLG